MVEKCLLLIIFLGVLFLTDIFGSEEKYWQCRGKTMAHWEEVPAAFDKCKADFDSGSDDVPQGQSGALCESVCMGRSLGVLTPEIGAVNRTGVNVRIDYHIPADARAELKKNVADCEDKYGSLVEKGATDGACTNYITFWSCMWIQAMKTCKTTFDPDVIGVKIGKDEQGNPVSKN